MFFCLEVVSSLDTQRIRSLCLFNASIVSRFDLLKHPFQKTRWSLWSNVLAEIERKHRRREDSSKCIEKLVAFLSQFEPERSDSSESQLDLPLKLAVIGFFTAFICMATEVPKRHVSGLRTKSKVDFRGLLCTFLRCKLRPLPRRVFPQL